MGIKLGICFCDPGPMSRCVAPSRADQEMCDYFEGATDASKCMFKGKVVKDHCWSPDAQKFGAEFGVRTIADFPEPEPESTVVDLDTFIDELPRRCCADCSKINFCGTLVFEQNRRGGLSDGDYWDIATNCPDFKGGQ